MRTDQRVLLIASTLLSLALLAYSMVGLKATLGMSPGMAGRARVLYGVVALMAVVSLVRMGLRYRKLLRLSSERARKELQE